MAHIAKNLLDLIGNTPLLELSRYSAKRELDVRLLGKLESFNPAGSVKDRILTQFENSVNTKFELTTPTYRVLIATRKLLASTNWWTI